MNHFKPQDVGQIALNSYVTLAVIWYLLESVIVLVADNDLLLGISSSKGRGWRVVRSIGAAIIFHYIFRVWSGSISAFSVIEEPRWAASLKHSPFWHGLAGWLSSHWLITTFAVGVIYTCLVAFALWLREVFPDGTDKEIVRAVLYLDSGSGYRNEDDFISFSRLTTFAIMSTVALGLRLANLVGENAHSLIGAWTSALRTRFSFTTWLYIVLCLALACMCSAVWLKLMKAALDTGWSSTFPTSSTFSEKRHLRYGLSLVVLLLASTTCFLGLIALLAAG